MVLSYDRPIATSYDISVTMKGVTLQATCPSPMQQFLPESDPPRIDSCDDHGVTVSGIDLGHGDNQTVGASVAIDDAAPISVVATLTNIVNSRGCDIVCHVHSGNVPNS